MSISAMKQALDLLETSWGCGHQETLDRWNETIEVLYEAIEQAEKQEPVAQCSYPKCQATNGCVGACSKTAPVHASDMSQERFDETAKDRHEPVEHTTFEQWIEQDEGIRRFGMQLKPEWLSAAKEGWDAAIQAEREAVAKLVEELDRDSDQHTNDNW